MLFYDLYFFLFTTRNKNLLLKHYFVKSTILSRKVCSSNRVEKPSSHDIVFQKFHNETIITRKERKKSKECTAQSATKINLKTESVAKINLKTESVAKINLKTESVAKINLKIERIENYGEKQKFTEKRLN